MFDDLIAIDPEIEPETPAPGRRRASRPAELPVADAAAVLELKDAPVTTLLNAQAGTVSWLDEVGAHTEDVREPALDEAAREAARAAFCSVTNPYVDPLKTKADLMALSAPPAVRHLATMLSEYDWEFVKQAKEIRGYIVAKLVEHSKSLDPKVSLQALSKLGLVTEIGAFQERIEVTHVHTDNTPTALVERLRERLHGFLPRSAQSGDVEDVEAVVLQ